MQLERQLRFAIDQHRIPAHTPMPSTRELAALLGLSRGVVVEAYEQLVAEGYVVAKRGSGSRVALRPPACDPSTVPGELPNNPPQDHAIRFDFTPGVPDARQFPRRTWAGCLRHACLHASDAQLGYPDPSGEWPLREALHRYLRRARGVACEPSNIVVCGGFTQGLNLLGHVFAPMGVRRLAVEHPGMRAWWGGLERVGIDVVPVDVGSHGIDLDCLERSGAQAVLVAPAHQFPTGAIMPMTQRMRLADWAERHGAWVIEDDYDAEFRHENQVLPALQGHHPTRVLYIGTASKSLSPALRLGWVLAPDVWVAPLVAAKRMLDRGSATIEQLAMARFIEHGHLDRHLRTMRTQYRQRRDALLLGLARWHVPVQVQGEASGLHVMLKMPLEVSEQQVVELAGRRGVKVVGAALFTLDKQRGPPALVLGYGRMVLPSIREAIAELGVVVEQCLQDAAEARRRHDLGARRPCGLSETA